MLVIEELVVVYGCFYVCMYSKTNRKNKREDNKIKEKKIKELEVKKKILKERKQVISRHRICLI